MGGVLKRGRDVLCDLHRDVVLDGGGTLFSRPFVWENDASRFLVKTDGVTTPQKNQCWRSRENGVKTLRDTQTPLEY